MEKGETTPDEATKKQETKYGLKSGNTQFRNTITGNGLRSQWTRSQRRRVQRNRILGFDPGEIAFSSLDLDGLEFNELECSRIKFSGPQFSEVKFSRLESSQNMKWHQFRPLRDLLRPLRELFGTPSGQSVINSSQVEGPEMPQVAKV